MDASSEPIKIEEFLFFFIISDGDSFILTSWELGTISIPSRFNWLDAATVFILSLFPTSLIFTLKASLASIEPLIISSGAKSPPIASITIE
ncbi:hypothetical protein ES703_99685 [subsurface metagenome]